MENTQLSLDGVQYTFRPGNFLESKKHAVNLTALLKGAIKTVNQPDGSSAVDVDIGGALANLGSPQMQGIETFVLKYLEADADGKTILLRNDENVNSHFGKYRDHYFQIMFEGLKYHFLPFLPAGLVSLSGMNFAQAIKALSQ